MKLFSGTANSQLTKKVAEVLQITLSKCEVVTFANSEIRVTIQEEVKDEACVVIQPTSNPTDTHLMELLFFADALKREGARKILGVTPYFGYARQNIQHRKGEAVSANVVINFLEVVGFSKIILFDIHDEATLGIFNIPTTHLSALPLLAERIAEDLSNKQEVVVVSPDQAGVERTRVFGEAFFGKQPFDIVVVEKKRNLDVPHESEAISLHGDVKNKTVVLVDDIITSGKTTINAANLCIENGARNVLAAVTHHDFSEEAPKLIQNSKIEKFFTTDTILLKEDQKIPKLEEITTASIISEELKNSHYV